MPVNHFRNWLNTRSNQQFWLNPIPSEQFDDLISNSAIQKSIADSKSNQLLYSYIENRIVLDYANLIDTKLREVFYTLNIDEFKDPSGFERKEKSSTNQTNYFELRNQLEFFLKQDIQQHKANPDAQLNAFRRWVEISDSLLKRHCYEGFLLIFVNLQIIASPNLINGLPRGLQENYHELCRLCAPGSNHSALRKFINKNTTEHDFNPLIFTYHAIAVINESIINIRQHEILLKGRKKVVSKEIRRLQKEMDTHEFNQINDLLAHHQKIPDELRAGNSYLIDLLRESKRIPKDLKRNNRVIKEQHQQRTNLIHLVQKEQAYKIKAIPDYLESTFKRLSFRFNKHKIEELMNISTPEPVSARNAPTSELYSRHLLPSFWQRAGKSQKNHWDDIFTPSCLHK